MVGEYAINLHRYQRLTGDINIWLKDTSENRKQLRKAFASCDMGDYPMIKYMQILPGWTDFHLHNDLCLDILIDMKGLQGYTFDECQQMVYVANIENVNVPFLHQPIKQKSC